MSWTNRGLRRMFGYAFRGETIPTQFYLTVVTAASPPTRDTKTMAELVEVAAGFGMTAGGVAVPRNSTGFPTLTENDTRGMAEVIIADTSITASGGTIPASGDNAKYIVLTGDNATLANRDVYAYWTYEYEQNAPDTETIDMNGLSLSLWADDMLTARGCYLLLSYVFRGAAVPTNYYMMLFTSATAPTSATNTAGQLTAIANGNGYTDGYALSRGVTDFPTAVTDDATDQVTLTVKTVYWTASGGSIPSSGNGAYYAALTTDEVTVANRQIIGWWVPVNPPLTATDGTQLTVGSVSSVATHGA